MWLRCCYILVFLLFAFEVENTSGGVRSANCTCGYTNSLSGRIINGFEAEVNEFPYMVLLWVNYLKLWRPNCGGSIITPFHILTAAHCFRTFSSPLDWRVTVGDHDFTIHNETTFQKIIGVSKIMIHPSFNTVDIVSDIAVMTTSARIPFSEAVGPVCLPAAPLKLEGQNLLVTGWGKLSFDEIKMSTTLMKVELQAIPLANCSSYYQGMINTTNPTQVCTYAPDRTTYKGDSGGPVAWVDPSLYIFVQVGLVSFGKNELGNPSVNTDVGAYIPWIQQQITDTIPLTGNLREKTCSII